MFSVARATRTWTRRSSSRNSRAGAPTAPYLRLSALRPRTAHVDEPPGIRHLADGHLDDRRARTLDRRADFASQLYWCGGASAGRAEERRELREVGVVQLA